jgi:hypothetical protein
MIMKKFLSTSLVAAIVATSFTTVPVSAIAMPAAREVSVPANDLVQVQQVRRFERRGDFIYLNGHRGYREPRRGYREFNGFWFPAAAFLGGLIIGGALDNGPR